ncbi:F-box/LRR-repeat protein 13-like [Chenopodium quinoa]|uniref:F-box domain-containing protein n=1 Tax=Chenopodium quinoa TaxID=63459 RepID=A0A803LJ97_CHEQI|nr:F-box/LRR-repeat protein 13-like [Chenopodium quinoa]
MAETLSNSNSPKKQRSKLNHNPSEIDRLSSLPDTLLFEILSLLPLNSAAAASTLSRRWLRLWTHRTHLFFDGCRPPYFKFPHFFTNTNHILNQLTSPHIHTFNLSFRHSPLTNNEFLLCSTLLDSWVPLICARNPVNFKVCFDFGFTGHFITLPPIIFETQSLVQLELLGNLYCKLPIGDINLSNLNKIVMRLRFDPRVLKTLFKSCPLLESLLVAFELMEDETIEISAHNLKSLTILMNGSSRASKFVIDAPLLEDIEINRCVALYSFVSKPRVLQKATIGFWTQIFEDGTDLTLLPEFLRGISSVKSIHLVDNLALFNSLNAIDANVWFDFHNLTHLSLIVSEEHVIWDAPISTHLLSRLKKIDISEVKLIGEDNDIKLVKYILSNANVLETLYISSDANYDDYDKGGSYKLWTKYMFCRRLFRLPRSSLTCKIEFYGAYITASVDGSGNGSVVSQIDWEGPVMWHDTDEDEE